MGYNRIRANQVTFQQFSAPSWAMGAADFGRINGTAVNNHEKQLGLKYLF